jgi:hypothetical protein
MNKKALTEADTRTPLEIVKLFGGKPGYMAAITDLESVLYENVA